MRNLILKIHLYGGLFCASYLLIFGVSSLNYNHHFGRRGEEKLSWERALSIEDMDDNGAFSRAVRDSLGLIGWPLSWETRRDRRGDLHFALARPGKRYRIHVLHREGRVEVEEQRTGFWAVVNQLHALMRVPPSRFMRIWGVYTEICVWVVLFSALSGVYLWATLGRDPAALVLLIGAGLSSLGFMFYVWWRG